MVTKHSVSRYLGGSNRTNPCVLAQLNGNQRVFANLARAQGENQTADILLAGWVANKPGILVLNNNGDLALEEAGLVVIGAESTALYLSYKVVETIRPVGVVDFRTILELAASSIVMCDPPIHIWRITAEGVFPLEPPQSTPIPSTPGQSGQLP